MWGGTVYPTAQVEEICDHAHAMDLKVHLDGARIFNAAAALGESVAQMMRKADSVMFCLSKGLARRWDRWSLATKDLSRGAHLSQDVRRRMRQAGVIAAAGLIALETSPGRLHIDHENAKRLAEGIAKFPDWRLIRRKYGRTS